ncbi:hypothetical protein PCG10_001872 [Penicillium crustosum]|uniref:Uncharacterized protein n=1 Tax=Penicillium crustosum TaxID=36656 RepID=A0A9P5GW49_PENCR|nr:uncharacterized protein N7487_003161 [Penicillium crustosum]KAF7527938.1 hypothetical protein PCG10_001872 [Penicillium crustosum]KAJ5419611.1 hypothetical protein N7487_003161 [Penicillium crustosum]
MRFTPAFLMLASAIGAIAAPAAEPVELEARDEGITIKICSSINLGGTCISPVIYIQHDCHNLNGSPVMDNVRSVSIPNGYRCRFWQSTTCNGGGTGDIQAGGSNDITSGSLSSVKCYKN